MSKFKKLITFSYGLNTISLTVPAIRIVCQTCKGTGKHVNRAIDEHGLTYDDFASDPDFEESYFNGDYDVTCEECEGLRVTDIIDDIFMQKRYPRILQAYYTHLDNESAYRREAAWEARYC